MSSGPSGEEPINLDSNRRLHYVRLLRLHGCVPRCDACRESQGILIAAGVPLPNRFRDTPDRVAPQVDYGDEWRRHRDCDPPCVDAAQALQHLLACGVDPAEVA